MAFWIFQQRFSNDKVKAIIINQLKLDVDDTYKKCEKKQQTLTNGWLRRSKQSLSRRKFMRIRWSFIVFRKQLQ